MCMTFICGAMKPVSLLFDLPTYVAKTKGLISCTDNAQLICAFVFMRKAGFLMTWLKSQYMYRAVYHLRGNHTVTLYEKREKIRYHLRVWPLG